MEALMNDLTDAYGTESAEDPRDNPLSSHPSCLITQLIKDYFDQIYIGALWMRGDLYG